MLNGVINLDFSSRMEAIQFVMNYQWFLWGNRANSQP